MKKAKRSLFFLFFAALLAGQCVSATAETVAGQAQSPAVSAPMPADSGTSSAAQPAMKQFPSGLLEISDYKYPVYLYAPANYRLDNSYPMIIVVPSQGAKAEEGIKYLKVLADRKGVFLLSPHGLWTDDGDVPYQLDEWLMKIKTDVLQRFPIDKKRVFLAGKESGAHYAAYLAIKYPDQFAGAALLGRAWAGPFSKIMEVRSSPSSQVPFFVALREDQTEVKAENQRWFLELQEKGYPVRLVEVKTNEDLSTIEFKNSMYDWLEKTAERWAVTVAQDQKSFKSKLKKGVKSFFVI